MLVMHDEDREEGRIKSPGIDSKPGRIHSLELIPGLLKRLQIRAQKYWIKHTVLSKFYIFIY
jgi:hypothetical protein